MKKFIIVFNFLILYSASCPAIPGWMTNPENDFPSEKYIRGIGEGFSEADAKKNAVSIISEYFNQSIYFQTEAYKTSTQKDSFNNVEAQIKQKYISSSESELLTVQYSESFYDNHSQKYFICAYIERSLAWNILFQKTEVIISSYNKIVNSLGTLNDSLSKIIMLNKAQSLYLDFISLYKTMLVIYPERCSSLTAFAKKSADDMTKLSLLRAETSINIIVTEDRQNIIKTVLTSILSEKGYIVSSQNAAYKLTANINWNESELNGIYTAFPQIQIEIHNDKKTAASFSGCCKKTSAYNRNTLNRISIYQLETLLKEKFYSECFR